MSLYLWKSEHWPKQYIKGKYYVWRVIFEYTLIGIIFAIDKFAPKKLHQMPVVSVILGNYFLARQKVTVGFWVGGCLCLSQLSNLYI